LSVKYTSSPGDKAPENGQNGKRLKKLPTTKAFTTVFTKAFTTVRTKAFTTVFTKAFTKAFTKVFTKVFTKAFTTVLTKAFTTVRSRWIAYNTCATSKRTR
jgi:hypothetical protein